MSEVRICGVPEVPGFIEQYQIKKLVSCLTNYRVVDMVYNLTPSVTSLDPNYWSNPENWMRLNMEDHADPSKKDAPTMEEVVKGITFGGNAIRSGQNLLVHCQLGMSRSPAIAIGSLLVAGSTIEDAFTKAKQVRPRIDPNPLIIDLIDKHLNLNGELVKYNAEFRGKLVSELKGEYKKLTEAYMGDVEVLSVIFENVSALNRL